MPAKANGVRWVEERNMEISVRLVLPVLLPLHLCFPHPQCRAEGRKASGRTEKQWLRRTINLALDSTFRFLHSKSILKLCWTPRNGWVKLAGRIFFIFLPLKLPRRSNTLDIPFIFLLPGMKTMKIVMHCRLTVALEDAANLGQSLVSSCTLAHLANPTFPQSSSGI